MKTENFLIAEGNFIGYDSRKKSNQEQDLFSMSLTRISHKHSSRFGQTVLSDDKESPAGRVKLTLPRVNLKSDGETGGQSGRTVCEKCALTLYSSIRPALMRKTLLRGTFFSGSGAFIIVLGGTMLPLSQLEIWGMPILFTGLILVFLGMTPYRRLTKLELNPYTLLIDGEKLFFQEGEKPLFSVLLATISSIDYVEKENIYGIALRISRPLEKKHEKLKPRFANLAVKEGIEAGLFFPYFFQKLF